MSETCDHRDAYGSTIIVGETPANAPVCLLCDERFPKWPFMPGLPLPEVDDVRKLGQGLPLPTARDLRGLARGVTGGLGSVEYVRRLRDD